MKADNVSENITPSKKKLVQARLPFKVISESPPTGKTETKPTKNDTPLPRKRKLSSQPNEVQIKKCKENTIITNEVPILIDDDNSTDDCNSESNETNKKMNPYVKLVQIKLKKKLKKGKESKRSKHLQKEPSNASDDNDVMIVDDCPALVSDTSDIGTNKEPETIRNNKTDENEEKNIEKDSCDLEALKPNEISLNLTERTDAVFEVKPEETDKSEINDNRVEPVESEDEAKSETINQNENDIEMIDENKDQQNCEESESPNNIEYPDGSPSRKNEFSDDVSTPKQTKRQSASGCEISSPAVTPLTPKQLQRKLDSAKKKEEKERERVEREKKRQQEKEERAKQRQEKEDQKRREREEREELKRKEREEKDEQKKKEKEERDRAKELERKEREDKEEQKRKEREEKEEQRKKEKEAREEERRRKQEALDEEKRQKELEKQEIENKKRKAAEAFVNFFVPKQKVEKQEAEQSKTSLLSSFTVKADMRLAPLVRNRLLETCRSKFDELLKNQTIKNDELYLSQLRNKVFDVRGCGKTWPLDERNDADDDVIFVENEDELPPVDATGQAITFESAKLEKIRAKLLSFHENRRPPYWGTWRKKSCNVTARRPFGQDQKILDYSIDSDDEWEEEGEGESIEGSAAGSDDEQEPIDEYEVDNEFFVPHGYLSDEEATLDEDDVMSLSPETQKLKLKHLEDEFESELKKPTEKLKPRIYGPVWETEMGECPSNCIDSLWRYFGRMTMILNDPTELLKAPQEPEKPESKSKKKKKDEQPQEKSEITKSKKEKPEGTKKEKTDAKKPQESKKSEKDIKKNQPQIMNFLKVKNT